MVNDKIDSKRFLLWGKTHSFCVFVIVFFALQGLSCSIITGNSDKDSSHIEWGKHIEGVRIGDDSTTVVRKLGPPSYMIGGDISGWMFYYTEGSQYHLMTIMISQDLKLHPGVYSMSVWSPYNNTTKDGVGLGMSREMVLNYLPPPDSTENKPDGSIFDLYYNKDNTFLARYDKDGILYMIGMGIPSVSYR